MSAERRKKLQKKEARTKVQRAKLSEDYDRVLSIMGIREAFDCLPQVSKEMIRSLKFPKPEVQIGEGVGEPDREKAIFSALKESIEKTVLLSTDRGDLFLVDYFRICLSVREAIGFNKDSQLTTSSASLVTKAKKDAKIFCEEILQSKLNRMLTDFDMVLAKFTRIDKNIYWYEPEYRRDKQGKGTLHIIVHKEAPQKVRIAVDNEARPAFRCGASFGSRGVHWVSLPARTFGIESEVDYPVYVQSHAIKKLHERVPLEGGEGIVHDCMWQSL